MTNEQREVLAHVVLDPEAWEAHAIETFGAERAAEMLAAKVARWRGNYEAAKVVANYKPRRKREEDEEKARKEEK
jgi:hypothetical protein